MYNGPVRDEELEPLAAEVRREFDGLRVCTMVAITLYGKKGLAGLMRDLAIPGINLHGRLLLDFLGPVLKRPRSDDVFAHHFVPEWDGEVDGGSLAYLRAIFLPSVNKRMAHLSARRVRVDADDDAVQVAEIYLSIAWVMERFLGMLTPERLRWFERDGKLPDTTASALGMTPSGSRA